MQELQGDQGITNSEDHLKETHIRYLKPDTQIIELVGGIVVGAVRLPHETRYVPVVRRVMQMAGQEVQGFVRLLRRRQLHRLLRRNTSAMI